MDEVRDLLDRQINALASRETAVDFLVSVGPFLRALTGEPRIAVHMDDLRDETTDRVRVLEELDSELLPDLVDLRQRLARLSSPPVAPSAPEGDPESLTNFDAIAAAPPERLNYRGEGARCGRLLAILQSNSPENAENEPESERWQVDLYNAEQRWSHASRWLFLEMRVSAGLALLRLETIPLALNPDPVFREVGDDQRAHLDRLLRVTVSTERQFFNAVHVGQLPPPMASFVDERVQELRAAVELLGTELHRRVGTTRSRQALISRFKQRAEWHDAARLRVIAQRSKMGGGHPEDRLTGELARFLFDQGLNPLTKPIAGGLQPDLLDPAVIPAFYVEAKQYERADRAGIIRALRQVLDTVGRLKSESLPITEAFCVVFRRAGPRYLLPDVFEAEGYRVYFTLVDIAPAELSGRRQRHPPTPIALEDLVDRSA